LYPPIENGDDFKNTTDTAILDKQQCFTNAEHHYHEHPNPESDFTATTLGKGHDSVLHGMVKLNGTLVEG